MKGLPNQLVHLTREDIGLDPRRLYVSLFPPTAQLTSPCRAWHRAYGVEVPVPGFSGAEGKEKGKGSRREVGSGGSPIQSCGAMNKNRI
jgi:hypothetical protein